MITCAALRPSRSASPHTSKPASTPRTASTDQRSISRRRQEPFRLACHVSGRWRRELHRQYVRRGGGGERGGGAPRRRRVHSTERGLAPAAGRGYRRRTAQLRPPLWLGPAQRVPGETLDRRCRFGAQLPGRGVAHLDGGGLGGRSAADLLLRAVRFLSSGVGLVDRGDRLNFVLRIPPDRGALFPAFLGHVASAVDDAIDRQARWGPDRMLTKPGARGRTGHAPTCGAGPACALGTAATLILLAGPFASIGAGQVPRMQVGATVSVQSRGCDRCRDPGTAAFYGAAFRLTLTRLGAMPLGVAAGIETGRRHQDRERQLGLGLWGGSSVTRNRLAPQQARR